MNGKRRVLRVNPKYASEIIDALGGTRQVSIICDVRDSSVSDWRKTGMPKSRFMYLSERYKKIVSAQFKSKQDLYV